MLSALRRTSCVALLFWRQQMKKNKTFLTTMLLLLMAIRVATDTTSMDIDKGIENHRYLRTESSRKTKRFFRNLRSLSEDISDDEGLLNRVLCWFGKKKPKLKLAIKIINDSGGTSDESEWVMHANCDTPSARSFKAVPDSSNKFHRVDANAPYKLSCVHSSSTGAGEYEELGWSCDGGKMVGDSVVKLSSGKKAVCTATVDDVAPSCDDGIDCTDDSWDAATEKCIHTDNCPSDQVCNLNDRLCQPVVTDPCAGVTCPPGQACDPNTGNCEDTQQVVPCVGIIDEWSYSQTKVNTWWKEFRDAYPLRPLLSAQPVAQIRQSLTCKYSK